MTAFGRRFVIALCLALGSACFGVEIDTLPPRDAVPPNGFFAPCTTDADCHAGYQCLLYSSPFVFGSGNVCTVRCATREDCPLYVSAHCGDITACSMGVCGMSGCR